MEEANALPTVTLAPPPGLVPSRSLHIQPIAVIPLVSSLSIMTITAIYIWKLWQREDKYYVEEVWTEDDGDDAEKRYEAMTFKPPAVSAPIPGIIIREGRPGTPESLMAARRGTWSPPPEVAVKAAVPQRRPSTPESLKVARLKETLSNTEIGEFNQARRHVLSPKAKAALAKGFISSPFTVKTNMPHDIKDPAWVSGPRSPQNDVLVPARKPGWVSVLSPLPVPSPLPVDAAQAPDDVASYRSTDTWERDSIEPPDLTGDPKRTGTRPTSPLEAQDDHDHRAGLLAPQAGENNVFRHSAQSERSRMETNITQFTVPQSDVVRRSRIDWIEDNGSSHIGSNYTYNYSSEGGGGTYHDRFADY